MTQYFVRRKLAQKRVLSHAAVLEITRMAVLICAAPLLSTRKPDKFLLGPTARWE
jgi:hypothetical protein